MPVSSWSTTAASNTAILSGITLDGSVMTVPQGDDAFREMAAQIATQLGKVGFEGADIASATTTDLSTATGWAVDITGTTTITGFGTVNAGQMFLLRFTGALTLTYNATSLITPEAQSILTAVNDVAFVKSEGSGNWRVMSYQRAGTTFPAVVTPSGVSSTVSSIPPWVSEIDIILNGVSLNGATNLVLLLGDSGGVENSGYTCTFGILKSSAVTTASSTTGFVLTNALASTSPNGLIQLRKAEAPAILGSDRTWVMTYAAADGDTYFFGAGNKATSAVLDRFLIGSANGTSTFDAGTFSYKWR